METTVRRYRPISFGPAGALLALGLLAAVARTGNKPESQQFVGFESGGFMREAPPKVLRDVRLEGRDEIHLLSGFVGKEWERVAEAMATR